MSLVSLTTDFGLKDYFVASIKAELYQEIEGVNVIDVSHQISPFNHTEAAYVLKNAYSAFPKGSIHIIGVDSEYTPENVHIVMFLDGHYFIGANNGILSLIKEDRIPEKIVEINIHENIVSSFPVLDVFVKVAGHIARKGSLDIIGKNINQIKEVTDVKPVINTLEDQILGSVIYIDNFGNVVTNINRKVFLEYHRGRAYTIFTKSVKLHTIYNSYTEAINFSIPKENREEDGKKIALFNAAGKLELSIYKSNPQTVGSAYSLFGLEFRDTITIKFE
ncbi:SAM-dependent chlorinase/fluorinase [Flavobacteriaceae bacterium]|nr:SAM-dependent chlorinase/fluorinase [Flavobacteriaceae bacterium]